MDLTKIIEERLSSNENNITRDTLLKLGIQPQLSNEEYRPIKDIFNDLCKVFRKFNTDNFNDNNAIIKNEYWYDGESAYRNPSAIENMIDERNKQMLYICRNLVGSRNSSQLYVVLSKA